MRNFRQRTLIIRLIEKCQMEFAGISINYNITTISSTNKQLFCRLCCNESSAHFRGLSFCFRLERGKTFFSIKAKKNVWKLSGGKCVDKATFNCPALRGSIFSLNKIHCFDYIKTKKVSTFWPCWLRQISSILQPPNLLSNHQISTLPISSAAIPWGVVSLANLFIISF